MVPAINEVVVPSRLSMASTRTTFCETNFCTDHTPLPPGCNKNYNLQFSAVKPIIVRDAVSTTDGGKLVVGDQHFNGLAIKYNENGDVAWSKQYETYFHESRFMRVIRTFDNNYLIFANRSISINSTGYSHMSMIKVDINGNVIWVRDLNERGGNRPLGTMADVTETPDGGFVLLVNGLYTSQAIRYDQNLNVIWKKEFVGVFNPVYKTVYYSNGAVYLQYQNPFLISTTSFGIEKLDLLTGNRIWSNIYTAGGPNSSVLLNRVFAINDTVYAFVTHKVPNASFDAASPVMVRLNPDGSLASSVQFQGDNIPPSPYFYTNEYDKNPPTVAITPYNDFVLTSRVAAGTDSLLRLARIGTEGTVAWSRVYNSSKYHHPFNIHTQGKGIVVMGAVMNRPTDPIQYFFTDAFLIKTDSSGELITGGAGSCTSTDRPLAPVPISFSVAPAGHTLQDVQNYTLSNGSISSMDFAVDATLLCSTPANCNTVTLKQRGTGCSLGDTLVYYLEDNADCDAAAAWHYDTAFFKAVHMNGDSIRIVPKKTGAFTINARIEGNCMITTQSITSSMGLSASQLALGNDALICDRQQIKLSAGRGYVTYKWNDNSTDSTLIITKPGKYYVDVTDNCGGAGTDTVLITAAGLVFKIAGNTTKCNSDTVLLQASAGYYNYQWSPKQNLQATSDRALVCPATTTRYYATAEKWPGCTLIDSILITTLVSPPVNLPGDSQLCTGDSMLVQAAAGFDTYQWNTGETQPAIKVRTPGSYLVTATFNNGCQSKDTFLLGWYPNPAPSLNKNSVLCAGSTRLLEPAQQYDGYLWSDGSTGHSMEINTTGSYWVTVTDGQGCKGADTTHVTTIAPLPAGFLPADTAICQYGKLTILPVHNYRSYLWSDLSISSSLTVKKSGLYWVTVTDQNGCSGSDSILVGSKQCLEGFYVPNAFTPNGDKQNEIFRPLIFGNLTSITFMVYNRWGGKVYETHDPSSGWNGKINARDAEKGTYVWMCRYTFTGQPEKIEKGIVELIR
jgi:gliding motility-associated-like protein